MRLLIIILFLIISSNGIADTKIVSAHLTNISTRAYVADNLENLITGFIISGSDPLQLVARAIGQGLNNFGIPSKLNPLFGVFTYPLYKIIDANDNWENTNSLAVNKLKQLKLNPPNYNDAASILSVSPSAYTVETKPNGHINFDIGLVELFELPLSRE